jgi:hypothetical protein
MPRLLNLLTNAFPLWVLAGGALALVHPPHGIDVERR